MSEGITEPTENQEATATEPNLADEVEKWKSLSKKNEARAKENAEKAKRLDDIEASSKSELEKLTDRLTKAEQETAQVPARVAAELKTHLVALGVVAKEDEVLLTAADPESLLAQVKRLNDRATDRRKNGNYVSREGQATNPPADDERAFARQLFSGN